MRGDHRDRLPHTARLLLVGVLLGTLLTAGAPLAVGIGVVIVVPGLGLRGGLPVLMVPLALAAIIALGVWCTGPCERLVARMFVGFPTRGAVAAEVGSAVALWAMLLPIAADALSAAVAASTAIAGFKAAEPLLERLERSV